MLCDFFTTIADIILRNISRNILRNKIVAWVPFATRKALLAIYYKKNSVLGYYTRIVGFQLSVDRREDVNPTRKTCTK